MLKTDALSQLNAFRMGVVPSDLQVTTIERSQAKISFEHLLVKVKEDANDILLLSGAYGAGKSHLLKVFRQEALSKGFLVCHVAIDSSFRLNKLDTLYYYIMHNLYTDKGMSIATFEDLFSYWLDNLRHAPDKTLASQEIKWVVDEMNRHHEAFARAFMGYIRASLVNDVERARTISAWLKGEKNIPHMIKKEFGVKGDVDPHLALDFLKAFNHLIQLMGYQGLIIMIDEIDLISSMRSDQRALAYSTLREMIDLMFNGDLPHFGLVLAGTEEVYLSEETGFVSHPPLAQRLSLKNATSFKHDHMVNLNHLTIDNLHDIARQLMTLYRVGYDQLHDADPLTACHLVLMDFKKHKILFTEITLRQFIQSYTSMLDGVRDDPHAMIYQMNISFSLQDNGEMFFKNTLVKKNKTP